jgi:hypothetical protein
MSDIALPWASGSLIAELHRLRAESLPVIAVKSRLGLVESVQPAHHAPAPKPILSSESAARLEYVTAHPMCSVMQCAEEWKITYPKAWLWLRTMSDRGLLTKIGRLYQAPGQVTPGQTTA